jgi:signal transduction histidine kinase
MLIFANSIPEMLKTVNIPNNTRTVTACEEGIPYIKLDPTFMRRILTNLVTNAVQAMPDGGILTVKAFKKEDKAIITVENTGEGISEDAKVKIFKPLFTTKAKGQGFGLPVVKRLIEVQSGTISFESQRGKGTIFTIILPIQKR